MNKRRSQHGCRSRSREIHQWEFEEAVDRLRRRADQRVLARHWPTTGHRVVDAAARAHVAEWWAADVLDGSIDGTDPAPSSVVEATLQRQLRATPWDLYVVEADGPAATSVRRLRDGRGLQIRWVEGRSAPPVSTTVALRVVHLDPPGLTAATRPVVFGDAATTQALVSALLRAFGDWPELDWREFMAATGARIALEYGLSHLRRCATRGVGRQPDAEAPRNPDDDLVQSFRQLESTLANSATAPEDRVELENGRIAWLEDIAAGPHLMVFDNVDDWRCYRDRRTEPPGRNRVSWCRLRRVPPEQLPDSERRDLHRDADNDATGVIRLEKRDHRGLFVEPTDGDVLAVCRACRQLAESDRRRVA